MATGRLNVVAAADVNHDNHQQGHDADHDSRHLHPTWRAGIGERVRHVRLLRLPRSGVMMDATYETRQYVRNHVNQRDAANVRYGTVSSICPGIVWQWRKCRSIDVLRPLYGQG